MRGVMDRLCRMVAKRLPARVINNQDGTPYLQRFFVLQIPDWRICGEYAGGNVYLHRFLDGDDTRGEHDHPWVTSFSLLLSGRYLEYRITNLWAAEKEARPLGPGCFNRIRQGDFHRIELVSKEVWTLFVHSPARHGWGFVTYDFTVTPPQPHLEHRHTYPAESPNFLWWTRNKRGRDIEDMGGVPL